MKVGHVTTYPWPKFNRDISKPWLLRTWVWVIFLPCENVYDHQMWNTGICTGSNIAAMQMQTCFLPNPAWVTDLLDIVILMFNSRALYYSTKRYITWHIYIFAWCHVITISITWSIINWQKTTHCILNIATKSWMHTDICVLSLLHDIY